MKRCSAVLQALCGRNARPLIFSAALLAVFSTSIGFGEEPPKVSYIASQSVAIRSDPGGSLAGTLLKNVPVMEIEQKGAWVHVGIDAWVPRTELQDAPSRAGGGGSQPSDYAVPKFEISQAPRDRKQDPAKLQLKIAVENRTPRDLSGWAGDLVVQDLKGKLIIRTPLEGGAIAARATAEFNFYFEESEKEFSALSPYISQNAQITVDLLNVRPR